MSMSWLKNNVIFPNLDTLTSNKHNDFFQKHFRILCGTYRIIKNKIFKGIYPRRVLSNTNVSCKLIDMC